MEQFFTKDYIGAPFVIFGAAHLAALGVVLLVNLLTPSLKRASLSARDTFRYGLAAILIINETLWHVWNAATGQWTIQTMLPLHLCSVLVWLSAYMLLTRNYRVFEVIYFLGIGGAAQALLTPDAGIYGFPHFRFFQTMISHGTIVTAAVFMTTVEGNRPTWKSLPRVFGAMNVYMLAVFPLNLLLGSNYLFIAHKPETASLIDVLGPWPSYILSLEGIGLAVSLVLYSPFAVKDWRARQAVGVS
jgi:hypothetical integral membrane protein (TIGR02206 family)